MASLRRLRKALDPYGLSVSRRTLSEEWAVYRPFTRDTITFVDIRDITDVNIERVVMSWALTDLFNTPSL